jgi:hypothetical protein
MEMNDLRTAAQQALEALEVYATHRVLPGPCPVRDAEYALRAALAQQDAPVATLTAQRDALLAALRWIGNVNAMDYEYQAKARAAIAAVEGETK